MDAVILAAGLGKRLRPITETIPKALVDIKGKPIIVRVLDELPDTITRVIIVVGYLGEKVQAAIGTTYGGKEIVYAQQEKPLGTLDALAAAKPLIQSGRFLVLHADDMVTKGDLEDLISQNGLSLFIVSHELAHPFGVCELDASGSRVVHFKEKPVYESIISPGGYVLDRDIFEISVPPNTKGEIVLATAIGELAKRKKIKAVRANHGQTVNTASDYERVNGMN